MFNTKFHTALVAEATSINTDPLLLSKTRMEGLWNVIMETVLKDEESKYESFETFTAVLFQVEVFWVVMLRSESHCNPCVSLGGD
jgi:hypothetical protein